MFRFWRARACLLVFVVAAFSSPTAGAEAQEPASPQAQQVDATGGWQFMQDGVVFAEFNRQGGPRGGREFILPHWWMGMGARSAGQGMVTFTGMLSLEAATLGRDGYREIFQVGETLDGAPLIDHQHPHDLFMRLAASWRTPLIGGVGFTIAGGPAGEPALGPVAFMHRPSASENAFAPLSHHILDSTHISFGVVTAALDYGPWMIEGSVFNGREPDEDRWDFDFGALDSVSGRLWFRPTDRWELQVSTGRLKDPEELEPGNVQRTTGSAAWFARNGDDYSAVTIAYGLNAAAHGRRSAVLGEVTKHFGLNSIYARAEALHVETAALLGASHVEGRVRDVVGAFTVGGVRDVLRWRGFEGGFGGAATFHAAPERLTATHGAHPVSFQLFFRLRPPATEGMGRMWNMRMSQPMSGHAH